MIDINQLMPLLDFIAKFESRGDYNIVWGGIKKQDQPPRPLVTMTVGQVLNWQDSIDSRYMSEAAGKYQIMEDTLRDLVTQGHASKSELFNKTTQDKLAVALLRRRGLDRYLSGKISAEVFGNNIAREWASMPVTTGPNKGRSYYAGDGLNKAHAGVGPFLNAVRSAIIPLEPSAPPVTEPTLPKKPATTGFWQKLFAEILRRFNDWKDR